MVLGIMLSGRKAAPRRAGQQEVGGTRACTHTCLEWRGTGLACWQWPSQEEGGGVSGDRRLTGGLELCLAGVNMESMEYGERDTEDCTAVEGNRAGQNPIQDPGLRRERKRLKRV